MSFWNTKIVGFHVNILSYSLKIHKSQIILHMRLFLLLFLFIRYSSIITKQETLHKHKGLEREVEMVEGSITQESTEPPKKSLLKNWPLMSSIITYCVFSLHDTAYSEVPFTHLAHFATLKYNDCEIYLWKFNIRYFLCGL